MKLKNKKTGKIIIAKFFVDYHSDDGADIGFYEKNSDGLTIHVYDNLAQLNEEWEDYEEPKDYWYLNSIGDVIRAVYKSDDLNRDLVAIGNYFETPEEAEKAVEKLKAWKRLKDGGFVFCGKGDCLDTIKFDYGPAGYNNQDFDLLFGGEE